MAWSIREAKELDVAGIAALNEVVQSLHYEQRPDRFKPPDRESVAPVVASWLRADGTRVWVAENDSRVSH